MHVNYHCYASLRRCICILLLNTTFDTTPSSCLSCNHHYHHHRRLFPPSPPSDADFNNLVSQMDEAGGTGILGGWRGWVGGGGGWGGNSNVRTITWLRDLI